MGHVPPVPTIDDEDAAFANKLTGIISTILTCRLDNKLDIDYAATLWGASVVALHDHLIQKGKDPRLMDAIERMIVSHLSGADLEAYQELEAYAQSL
jgi:hypothetical protein